MSPVLRTRRIQPPPTLLPRDGPEPAMLKPVLPVESEAIPSRVSSVASTPHHHTVTVDAFIPPIISPQEGLPRGG